jgi:alanyl-tRNA synthetase
MPTTKRYWDDPFLLSFDSPGAALAAWDGHPSLTLPSTAFYPEAGGQLGDTGWLTLGGERVEVTDTQIDDAGVIHHLLGSATSSLTPGSLDGATVHGEVDRARRLDHTAHHTAQHMLSAALAQGVRAETVSSRLGRASCTIDLDVPGLGDRALADAETLVNDVIRSDVTVRAFFPTPEELEALRLRRAPKVASGVRVIDIDAFDLSPCGGTHCTRTGQIGVVRITATEKYKGKVRVSFSAAARVLGEMRATDAIVAALGAELTCGPPDLAPALRKLKADLKAAREALGLARAEVAQRVADDALARHPPTVGGGDTPVVVVRDGDDVPTLRVLAARLASRADVVAICLAKADEGDDYAVVVQRGSGSSFDCGAWLKRVAAAHGGRGGGRPERAEGRVHANAARDANVHAI